MADVDHPNTHVENQEDADLPRTQPESPKHSGIDPLTEGDTMYPSEDTKSESEKLAKKAAKDEPTPVDESYLNDDEPTNPEGAERTEHSNVGRTEPVKADGKVQPQTARPANTNDSEVADGSTEPDASDRNAATGEAKSENRKEAESNGSGTSAPTSAKASAKADPAKAKSPADK